MSSTTIPKRTTAEASKARIARYRQRTELHIQAAAIRRNAPVRLPPKKLAAARAAITKYGRVEADGGLWVTVGKEAGRPEKLAVARLPRSLETAGLAVRVAGDGESRGATWHLRFVVALEPRQAWRQKLVDKELALRWDAAERAEFRFLVKSV